MVDNVVFHSVLVERSNDCCLFYHDFNLNDEKEYIPCTDIDPDSCYYNEPGVSIQMNSN